MKTALTAIILLLAGTWTSRAGTAFSRDEHTVALWNFDEAAGDRITDEGPLHIPMRLHHPDGEPVSRVAGRFGSALCFTGHNRLLARPDAPVILLENAVTVEAWIKIDADTMTPRMGVIQNMVWKESGYRLEIVNDRAVWMVEAPGQELALASSAPVPLDEWVFLAASYDGVTMRLFMNRKFDGEKSAPGGVVSPNTPKLLIGYSDGKEEPYFHGWIDAIRISNSVRGGAASR